MRTFRTATTLLICFTASCDGSDAIAPREPRPEWADGVDWSGTATMKTGTALRASFRLNTKVADGILGSKYWQIIPYPARIENAVTGIGGFSQGAGSNDQAWIAFFPRETMIDGVTPKCPAVPPSPGIENIPQYNAQVHITDDGLLEGTIQLYCSTASGVFRFDSQPIVMRRVS